MSNYLGMKGIFKCMKFKKKLLKSMNSYNTSYDDLKMMRISSNRRTGKKTLKIKLKDIDNA